METCETSWWRWGTYALLNLQDVAVLAVVTRILTLTDDISELIKQCGHAKVFWSGLCSQQPPPPFLSSTRGCRE